MQPRVYSHTHPGLYHNNVQWVFNPSAAVFDTGISPGTINYQGDGYKRKRKKRNRTQELFDALEASIRYIVLGEPIPGEVADTPDALATVPVSLTASVYDPAIRHLIALASDQAVLSARVHRLQHDLAVYERHILDQRDRDDEDDWMMLS